jgi:hypothetical protein
MKRNLILLSILVLTACSVAPTESASLFVPQPDTVILKADSPPAEIQRAMLQSATMWKTLQLSGTITWYSADGSTQVYQEQTWIDPLNSRYKVELNGVTNSSDKVVKFGDGNNNYNINMNSGLVETSPYPDFARAGQYVPPLEEGVANPNPMWGQMGTPLSEMAFSSNYAQGKGTFKSLGIIEKIAGREALIVEWTYIENTSPSWKMWLDVTTAVILKLQEFGVKDGTNALQGERVASQIIYNLKFDPSLFVMPANIPQADMPTQVGSIPVITESPLSAGDGQTDEAGELYFFLQPRQTGGAIELARVSGVCVFDSAKCPPVEKIKVPFALRFTINALSWPPDGKFAAFAYPDNPNGTPQKLFIFDPAAKTWKSIAEFPYIDPPFWSPDGNFIAFRTQDGFGAEEVYVIRRDGSDLKSVSGGLPAEGKPYIMDGWYKENIIMRSAMSVGGLYLVRASDGTVQPMLDLSLTKQPFIAAPDASLFAYDDYDPSAQKHALKVITPEGANPVTLASFTGGSIYPVVWSPDSALIAFNYYSASASGAPGAEVYVVSRDGGKISSMYKGTTVGRLVFSPNGKYLLVEETTSISGGHLFIINLATLEQKMLQAPGLSTDYDWYAPSWRP